MKTIYESGMFPKIPTIGYCDDPEDRFFGWIFAKHPDNEQWVSLAKIPTAPASPPVPAADATLRAKFLEGADDILQWAGCFSGDCPHETQAECELAVFQTGRQVAAEYLQDAAPSPSVPASPSETRGRRETGRRPAYKEWLRENPVIRHSDYVEAAFEAGFRAALSHPQPSQGEA